MTVSGSVEPTEQPPADPPATGTQTHRVRRGRRVLTAAVACLCGLMISVSAINARGQDLRPDRQTDLIGLIESQAARNADLTARAAALRDEVDTLTRTDSDDPELQRQLAEAEAAAAMTPVVGPALSVTLTDAPSEMIESAASDNALVVHQQDIQAVANAMWAAGAEAVTIQGVRVITTTGIKCVGNTVVLHGRPYAPPYVITAIGDPARMSESLAADRHLQIYRQYSEAYQLGYREEPLVEVEMPAHEGGADLRYAQPG
ncbi:DUF881 domain-containing protein [Naumannella halotolerans]|uniref:DUF881 domain-containing protein n=1 Tax=Naumannella halotolerans TaxID=993414 RepID=UPI00370D5CF3